MKFDIQSRQNPQFGSDDLVPNFGPTMKVLSKFNKIGTKDKWNIRIDIHCLYSGQFYFKIEICSPVIQKTWNLNCS